MWYFAMQYRAALQIYVLLVAAIHRYVAGQADRDGHLAGADHQGGLQQDHLGTGHWTLDRN